MIRLLALLLLLAAPLGAQQYPQPKTPHVNDFADLLPEADEAELTRLLRNLRADHGVEMTVVTIASRIDYGSSDTIEAFATGLFNAWGVGNATRNDGIMVLVARQDREMRIELGAGYDPAWDGQAQVMIDDYFLPSFRADNYLRGIMTGTARTIERIAVANAEGNPAPDDGDTAIGVGLGAAFLAFFAFVFRHWFADRITTLRRCPQCGQRLLGVTRKKVTPASRIAAGQGQRDIRCSGCNYGDRSTYVIPMIRTHTSRGGSFGGGRSSGGGASGRW